jgi:hypothetical protein
MLILGILAFALTLGLMSVFPKTKQALSRHRSLVIVLSLFYLAFLIVHPYIFGLPGRIAEHRFQKNIHSGMTRSRILRLAEAYGGRGLLGGQLYAQRSDGLLIVSFADWSTLCIVGGKEYDFYFRPDSTLTGWKTRRWENAC